MNENQAIRFDKIENRLNSIYAEIDKLSKKKPDSAINTYKLRLINNLFQEANILFEEGNFDIEKFHLFDDGELPTYSDVIIVLTQYIQVLDYFRFRNTGLKYGSIHWHLDDDKTLKTKRSKFS